jgi:hypothetical protein
VLVDVVGGFTVAGLDASPAAAGGADVDAAADGTASETLVTSILKVGVGQGCCNS